MGEHNFFPQEKTRRVRRAEASPWGVPLNKGGDPEWASKVGSPAVFFVGGGDKFDDLFCEVVGKADEGWIRNHFEDDDDFLEVI